MKLTVVKLSVLERLKLLSILPPEGNFLTMRIIFQLRQTLSFTEQEHERLGLKEENGMATWERSEDQEFRFGPKAAGVIREILEKKDRESSLNMDMMSVAEKFLPMEDMDEALIERGEQESNGQLEPASLTN